MYSSVGKMNCFLCSNIADELLVEAAEYHLYCKYCGEYKITVQAEIELKNTQKDIRYILSSQTFEKYYYNKEPLKILAKDIRNAKDITFSEKIYKLAKYLYHETKKNCLGTEIKNIRYSQFFCKNNNEYFQLLETLKSIEIIEFEKTDGPSGAKGTHSTMYGDPKLLGSAMWKFEKGINSIEVFEKVFMATEKQEVKARQTIKLNFQDNFSHITESDDEMTGKVYDVFISHASEDKDDFVKPFATLLKEKGLKVWYDEFEFKIGDKLRRKIDEGLNKSNYGIVVLSHSFFSKEWPKKELDGLFAIEDNGRDVILPIWHKISKDEVTSYSPTIAGAFVLRTSIHSIEEIVEKIVERVKPEYMRTI